MKIVEKVAPLNKLRGIRIAWGVNIVDFSRDIGLCKSMIDYIEKGERSMTYAEAVKIANYFGMTPDELFYDDYKEFFKNILI